MSDIGDIISDFNDVVLESNGVVYPEEFSIFEGCQANTVMCCFVQDRQFGDDNGNCAENDCADADPADNTDICRVNIGSIDLSTSHVAGGTVTFPGGSEGDTHCHGFAWSNDASHPSAMYRGNNLYYVSVYDHFYTRGYVRNVPGASMCTCVENAAEVSRSDCTEIIVTEDTTMSLDTNGLTAQVTNIDIDFNACQGANNNNNDLRAYTQRLRDEGHITSAQFNIVRNNIKGNC